MASFRSSCAKPWRPAPAPHEANLFDLQAKYAEVRALDQACVIWAACLVPA
jgi:hypothetical protein